MTTDYVNTGGPPEPSGPKGPCLRCGHFSRSLMWCDAVKKPCRGRPLRGCPIQTKEKKEMTVKKKAKTSKKKSVVKAKALPTPPEGLKGNKLYHWRVKHGICGRCGKRPRGRFSACSVCRQTQRRKQARKAEQGVRNGKPATVRITSDLGAYDIPVRGSVQVIVRGTELKVPV